MVRRTSAARAPTSDVKCTKTAEPGVLCGLCVLLFRVTHRHSCQMSARHCRRHSRRRDGGASQRPASITPSSNVSRGRPMRRPFRSRRSASSLIASPFAGPDAPCGERDRFEVLVARERGGERFRAGASQVEIAARRTLVAAGAARVLPLRRDVAERFELVERGVDGAGGAAGSGSTSWTRPAAVGDRVQDGNVAERERRALCHTRLCYMPTYVGCQEMDEWWGGVVPRGRVGPVGPVGHVGQVGPAEGAGRSGGSGKNPSALPRPTDPTYLTYPTYRSTRGTRSRRRVPTCG